MKAGVQKRLAKLERVAGPDPLRQPRPATLRVIADIICLFGERSECDVAEFREWAASRWSHEPGWQSVIQALHRRGALVMAKGNVIRRTARLRELFPSAEPDLVGQE